MTLIVFATYAKYLLFQGTFCRQAPAPSAAFWSVSSCSRNEGGGERIKQKCAAICSEFLLPAVACRIATMRQIHIVSWRTSWGVVAVEELWCRRNEDTKLPRRTVYNKEPYNSSGFLFNGSETHYVTKAKGRCCSFEAHDWKYSTHQSVQPLTPVSECAWNKQSVLNIFLSLKGNDLPLVFFSFLFFSTCFRLAID